MKNQLLLFLAFLCAGAGYAQYDIRLHSTNGISDQYNSVPAATIPFNYADAKSQFGLNPNSSLVLTKKESNLGSLT